MTNIKDVTQDEVALESINGDFLELHGVSTSLESLIFNLESTSLEGFTRQGMDFAQQHLNQLRTQCGMESLSLEDASSLMEQARNFLKKLMTAIMDAVAKMSEIIQRIITKMRLSVKKSVEQPENLKRKAISAGLHNAGHTLTINTQRRGLVCRGKVVKDLKPLLDFLDYAQDTSKFTLELSNSLKTVEDHLVSGLNKPETFNIESLVDVKFPSPKSMSHSHDDENGGAVFESVEFVGGFSYSLSLLSPAIAFKKSGNHGALPATGLTFQLDVVQPDVANEDIDIIFFPAQNFDVLIKAYWGIEEVMSVMEDSVVQVERTAAVNTKILKNAIAALDDDEDETSIDQIRSISRAYAFCLASKKQNYSFGRLIFANCLNVLEAHKHWAEESVKQASLDVVKDSAKKK